MTVIWSEGGVQREDNNVPHPHIIIRCTPFMWLLSQLQL